MRLRLFSGFVLITLSLALAGCGGNGNSSSQTSSSSSLTGNWQVTASSSTFPGTSVLMVGNLHSVGNSVSGMMHISDSSCFTFDTGIPVSGTVNGTTVTLTSQVVENQVISATANAASSGSILTGTYSIAGGCAGGDRGTVSGTKVPSFSGNWTGKFVSDLGQQVGVSTTLTQNSADADGFFSVSGPVRFTNSPCFTTGTISTSLGIGGTILVDIATPDGGTTQFTGNATNLASGSPLTGSYSVQGGTCGGDSGTGTLTR
jgi:hypothetical protein